MTLAGNTLLTLVPEQQRCTHYQEAPPPATCTTLRASARSGAQL